MKAFLDVLRAIPSIVSLLKEIFKALGEWREQSEKKKRAQELREAVNEARETKNTKKLEEFFGGTRLESTPRGGESVPETPPVDS